MKRSDVIKIIVDKLFYGKLAEAARSDVRPKFITDLAEEDAESILKELEDVGMYYCPVEDLGSMGKLRTPKGFEPVAKIRQELDDMVDRINDDVEFNKAIDKLIDEDNQLLKKLQLLEDQETPSKDFEETFKKRFKDIIA